MLNLFLSEREVILLGGLWDFWHPYSTQLNSVLGTKHQPATLVQRQDRSWRGLLDIKKKFEILGYIKVKAMEYLIVGSKA